MPIRDLAEYFELTEVITIDEPWQLWLGIPGPVSGKAEQVVKSVRPRWKWKFNEVASWLTAAKVISKN